MEVNKSLIADDPNNSSTANLLAGASFTGSASVAVSGGVIQVLLHTDQVCNVYIQQSADGVNWDHQLTFTPDADRSLEGNSEAWSVRSHALYYRIIVTNPTAVPTTYFRLATRLLTNGNGGVAMLVDDDGHAIEATQDSLGEYDLGVCAVQKVLPSANNSATGTNLTVGGVWLGTNETTLGVAAIQVMLSADQNCLVTVEQSGSGTGSGVNYDISDAYTYYSAVGGGAWTTQAVGSTYRVKVKNTGTASTSFLRLSTTMCPIVEAVPRALSSNGNFRVAVNELLGTFGTQVKSTPMGQMRTADTSRLVGASFGDSPVVDLSFWGSVTVGTGTIIPGSNMANIQTGASVAGSGTLRSVRVGRYVATNPILYRGVIRVPLAVGPCIRRWGAYSIMDGFLFEWNGSDLTLICRKNGVDTNRVTSGSFNGDAGNWYAIDGNAHTYEIYWTNKSAWFCVDDVILHKFTGATAPLTNTCSLPVAGEVFNSPNNSGNNNTLEVRTSSISRLGPLMTEPIYKYIATTGTTVCKYGAGRLHRLVVNNPNAGLQTVAVADSIAGNSPLIANLTFPAIPAQAATQPLSLEFGCPFFTGLVVVTSTGNGVTIIYE